MVKKSTVKKIENWVDNPCVENLLSVKEYDSLPSRAKGYVCYMQASWEESNISEENPYKKGSRNYKAFNEGEHSAMMEVQEIE